MTYYDKEFDEMIMRDFLALDRTRLANERTFLAYLRTFVGLFAAGVGLVKFVDSPVYVVIGYIFVAISPFIVAIGVARFLHTRRRLAALILRNHALASEEAAAEAASDGAHPQ